MDEKLNWQDIEEIAYRLSQKYPQQNPLEVRFTDLKQRVESLPGFEADPGHNVNEQILEAIQAAWDEEYQDAGEDRDEDDKRYVPPSPFRPED